MGVIVCGLGDVALRVVEQLHAAGEPVVVVDDDFDPRLARVLRGLDVALIAGSARRLDVLEQAGMATADALVCVDNDDLVNLEVALLVQRVRPQLRLVVAQTNPAVGRAISRVIRTATVLDVATLAAPSFVEACIGTDDHEISLDGAEFHVRRQTARRAGSIRSQFGDLAPVAVVAAAGELTVCPGRDHLLVAGDQVSVLGPPAEFATERRRLQPTARGPGHRLTRWRRALAWPRLVLAESDRALRLALATLLGAGVVSVVVLLGSYRDASGRHRMGVIDAVYFTTETVTGVGYGDFSFVDQPAWLRVWAIGLMLGGAAIVTIVYALLTNYLVSRRLAESQGRRAVTGMSGHVVVVGLGAVGLRVVEALSELGRDVVVLDRDEDNRFLSRARELKVPVVIGDSTRPPGLVAANVRAAAAVAVVTSNDLANIETGLAVEDLAADVPVVLRVFDRQLAHTLADAFGFGATRSVAALAAPWFVGAALGLSVQNTFYVGEQPFLVGRLEIGEAGGLAGHAMADLGAQLRVIAIRRAGRVELEFPPRRDTRFARGDEAFLVGPYEELIALLRRNRAVTA